MAGWIYNPVVGLGRTEDPTPLLAIRDGAPRPEVTPEKRNRCNSQETVPFASESPRAQVPIQVQVQI